jgi:arabinosyltransferase C
MLILLVFIGADIGQRSIDAQVHQSYGITDSWFDEFRRYALLSDFAAGTIVRRGAVALIGLTVLAFLTRRTRGANTALDLPARTLIIGLVLLVAVPSKWPWHFGALLGVAAVAAAIETHRIRTDESRPRGWRPRWLLAVVALTIAIAWSWGPREPWTLLDATVLSWADTPATLIALAVAMPTLAVVAMVLASRLLNRPTADAPWRVSTWAVPLVALPMVVFTLGFLATDAARSEWSLARQNLASIRGDAGCGLADALQVPRWDSMRPMPVRVSPADRLPPAGSIPPAPVSGLDAYPLRPSRGEHVTTPWFDVNSGGMLGLFLFGHRNVSDKLTIEWGATRHGRVESVGSDRIAADPTVTAAGVSPWLFLPADALPRRPKAAGLVRAALLSSGDSSSALAVATPVTYRTQALSHALSQSGVTALISPAFRMYMPCAELPRLGDGLAEAPNYVLFTRIWIEPNLPVGYKTSPFRGVADLHTLDRVSTAGSIVNDRLLIWRVDTRRPGGTLLEPSPPITRRA